MGQTTGRVLKSSDVQIEGRLSLDLEHPVQPGQNGRSTASSMTAAKVRILENQNEFAVMEVTCCCGRKTVIRCDYGGVAAVRNIESSSPAPNSAVNRDPEKKL